MEYIFETERLRLRKLTHDDADFIIDLLNSPGWLKFIGNRKVETTEEAIAYLENGPIKSYAENGYGLSLVENKDNIPVGMCGLINRDYLDNPDIGFALLPGFIGNGYAYEIASATLAFAKEKLNLIKIQAITVPGNAKSIQLLEKLGLKFTGTVIPPDSDEELLLFST